MAPTAALSDEECQFLRQQQCRPQGNRPFVTLTWAQSLDGMIAHQPGALTKLSGSESKAATHYLRSLHDAILVGGGTAQCDDPSLNCRYPGAGEEGHPQPVILDPSHVWTKPRDSTVFRLGEEGNGKKPWIVRSPGASVDESSDIETIEIEAKWEKSGGCKHIAWDDILAELYKKGIQSVMIEGGASIIRALLKRPDLVDSVIITIAPTFLGDKAVSIAPDPIIRLRESDEYHNPASVVGERWLQFGRDMVLSGQLRAHTMHHPVYGNIVAYSRQTGDCVFEKPPGVEQSTQQVHGVD
jgi:2,5-diamino-6-(ribosylamino)-4(3H)-pyrimidinone 5'-phosphate reductase